MYSRELAKTPSQISFIYFQSHSWYSVRNYIIPKGIMKTRFEPRLPRLSSWKSIIHHTLYLNSGPLHKMKVFYHWTIKARYLRSPQSCIRQDPIWGYKSVKSVKPVKVTGKNDSPWKFWMELIFSWMELIFLFWNSYVGFWTEVWLNFFSGNIYSLKSNTYFWGTVMFVQDGFLYLILTIHKLTVQFNIWATGRTSAQP